MADPVASVVAAPKKAFSFASNNLLAFVVLAVVLMVVFVAIEVRKPGQISQKVAKIPVIGKWALKQSA
jgi:type II secretory pathway component PulF